MGDRVLRPERAVDVPLEDSLRGHARDDVMRPVAARHIGKRRRAVRRGIRRQCRRDPAELRAGALRRRERERERGCGREAAGSGKAGGSGNTGRS